MKGPRVTGWSANGNEGVRVGVSAYRRVGVPACGRAGVWACRRVGVPACGRAGVWCGRVSVVGRKSRRGQRKPPCWLNRAGFEPLGVRRAGEVGTLSGPSEPREVVRPRRGSNPARIRIV
jgi:hypothetical protein